MTDKQKHTKDRLAKAGLPKNMLNVTPETDGVFDLTQWKSYMRMEEKNAARVRVRNCTFEGDDMLLTARCAAKICLDAFPSVTAISFWNVFQSACNSPADFYNLYDTPLLLIEDFPVSEKGGWSEMFPERKTFYFIEDMIKRRTDDGLPTFLQTDGKLGVNFSAWWRKSLYNRFAPTCHTVTSK